MNMHIRAKNELDAFIGIDLGGTKISAVLLDRGGHIVRRNERPTYAERGVDAVIRQITDGIDSLFSGNGPSFHPSIMGIGVATAGVLDSANGIVKFAANLRWKEVALGPFLSARYRCPVRLYNDANAAAFGEWQMGAGIGTDNCLYVTVSTGIGCGIISGGRLITGVEDSAGELGHISIDSNGPRCSCGNYGCLERYCSGTAIARIASEQVRLMKVDAALISKLAGNDPEAVTALTVAKAAELQDPLALRLLREAGTALGIGIVSVIHLLNPEVVIIGGGAANIGEPLLEPMRAVVRERGISSMTANVKMVWSALGKDAGMIGAAALIMGE
ncbi:ROK family protein (plasmid) [Paenibacillus cellulosilyticus]|nr:ROK family protein [Paenibacillus cellulosilyticus]